jgi:inosine-uridine nucleoside N-ribohydrolase
MPALNRIIIDTDPGKLSISFITKITILTKVKGVDDVLALLLALASKPEELELLLISVTYGNVEVQR